MQKIATHALLICLLCSLGLVVRARAAPTLKPALALSYADIADLSIMAPVAAHVRIRSAERIKSSPTVRVPEAKKRFLVTAEVIALVRGAGGVPPQIRYLVDLPEDARGKVPKLKKAEMMVFGASVPKRSGEIQLIAPDAQVLVFAGLVDQVRNILTQSMRETAPPLIRGVGDAFHVSGALWGQGETQIFLITGDGRPASLSIWREPGLKPRWAVSLDEIVDQGAGPPKRDTLLWYRLACFLPPRLAADSTERLDPESAQIAEEDYQTILSGLGKCTRMRG